MNAAESKFQESQENEGADLEISAVRAAIGEPKAEESKGHEKCIVINISGHVFLDIDAYKSVLQMV